MIKYFICSYQANSQIVQQREQNGFTLLEERDFLSFGFDPDNGIQRKSVGLYEKSGRYHGGTPPPSK